MILPNMTDDEKGFEAFRIRDLARRWAYDFRKEAAPKFEQAFKYPYNLFRKHEDGYGNVWTLLFCLPSKEDRKRGWMRSTIFTTYDVEKKNIKGKVRNDGNTGKGFIAFDPLTLWRNDGGIMEFIPHAIHRYTQRYLKPIGKLDMPIDKKVASITSRWLYYNLGGDDYSQKYNSRGFLAYDAYMKGGGMFRGQLSNAVYVKFYTYISEDMLYDNQREIQKRINAEYQSLMNKGSLIYKTRGK